MVALRAIGAMFLLIIIYASMQSVPFHDGDQMIVADPCGPYEGVEGSPIVFDAGCTPASGNASLQYRWDFDNDSLWDTNWSYDRNSTYTWGDDYQGDIALQVMSLGDGREDINAEGNYIWFGAVNYMEERGQSFVPKQGLLAKIAVDVRISFGTPNADLFLFVRESIDGPNLAHASIPPEELPRDPYPPPEDWPEFDFPDIEVEIGKEYYFVLTSPMTGGGNFEIHLSNDTYADGNAFYKLYGRGWESYIQMDLRFRTYASEMKLSEPGYTTVTVMNSDPTVDLGILPMGTSIALKIAGEKWHDVSVELHEEGVPIANGSVIRHPGNPNYQMLDLTYLQVDVSKRYSATVRYTPEDDPMNGQPNGATPCWIILTFEDGEELRLHHNFNVNHPDRYVWEVDLVATILSHGLTFEATAFDPGADCLTFFWSFGDGTNSTSFYPNANSTYPVQITETTSHAFLSSGSFTVTLTVTDDDGGVGVATVNIVIP